MDATPACRLEPDVITCSILISSRGRANKWSGACWLFAFARGTTLQPDHVMHGAAVAACAFAGRWVEALEFVSVQRAAGSQPGAIPHNACISAFEKQGGLWRKVLSLLQALARNRVRASCATHGATLSACEKASCWEHGLEMLGSLQVSAVELNIVVFSSVASACQRCGRAESALAMLVSASKCHVELDNIIFNTAVSACEKSDWWEKALDILREMQVNSVQVDATTVSAMISACERSREWRVALCTFTTMQRMVALNVVAWRAIAGACGKSSRWRDSAALLSLARSRALEVHPPIPALGAGYLVTLSACAASWSWRQAMVVRSGNLGSPRSSAQLVSSVVAEADALCLSACERALKVHPAPALCATCSIVSVEALRRCAERWVQPSVPTRSLS